MVGYFRRNTQPLGLIRLELNRWKDKIAVAIERLFNDNRHQGQGERGRLVKTPSGAAGNGLSGLRNQDRSFGRVLAAGRRVDWQVSRVYFLSDRPPYVPPGKAMILEPLWSVRGRSGGGQ